MKNLFLSLFLLTVMFFSCSVQSADENPGTAAPGDEIANPFQNLDELVTETNGYGITGAGISNLICGMEPLPGSADHPVVTVELGETVSGPDADNAAECLMEGKDPFSRELVGGWIRYAVGKEKETGYGAGITPDEWKIAVEEKIGKRFGKKKDGKARAVNRKELDAVFRQVREERFRTLLKETGTEMSNRYFRMKRNLAEYSGMLKSGYRRTELEKSFGDSAERVSEKFRLRGATNLKSATAGKSTLEDRKKFHDYVMANALSGDVCVYFDPGDFLIGGHSFLWNASKKKVLSSGLGTYGIGSAAPGASGCAYYDPDGSFPYLNHAEMWLLRPVKPYTAGAIERQMDAFEYAHRMSGYSVQPFVYDTASGTYCNQVVFLTWKAYDGRTVSSGAPLAWVPYYSCQRVTVKVVLFGFVYWQDFWVMQVAYYPVDTGFGIITGNDILHDDDLKCVALCR